MVQKKVTFSKYAYLMLIPSNTSLCKYKHQLWWSNSDCINARNSYLLDIRKKKYGFTWYVG